MAALGKSTKIIGLIPARGGSLRVPGKNIRPLAGHPLIAYSIAAAFQSGIFDRIVVSTDSELTREIGAYYGADVPFLRPKEFSSSVSPDIDWIKHALQQLPENYEAFSILRPTSPFRTPETIRRAWSQFKELSGVDSIRAVELCRQHPGKMWIVDGFRMKPFMEQSGMELPWHARQYQDLPKVYVQNSSLEMAWTRVVWETNSREGRTIAPFLTEFAEGFSIDYEEDWHLAELFITRGMINLPPPHREPFHLARPGFP